MDEILKKNFEDSVELAHHIANGGICPTLCQSACEAVETLVTTARGFHAARFVAGRVVFSVIFRISSLRVVAWLFVFCLHSVLRYLGELSDVAEKVVCGRWTLEIAGEAQSYERVEKN